MPIIDDNQIENNTIFPLTTVILNKNIIVGGYDDGLIVQWNHVFEKPKFFKKLNKKNAEIIVFCEGHQKYINSILLIDNNKFLSSSLDNSLRIWDIMVCIGCF